MPAFQRRTSSTSPFNGNLPPIINEIIAVNPDMDIDAEDIDDVLPPLFCCTVYRPHPLSSLEHDRFDKAAQWLAGLSRSTSAMWNLRRSTTTHSKGRHCDYAKHGVLDAIVPPTVDYASIDEEIPRRKCDATRFDAKRNLAGDHGDIVDRVRRVHFRSTARWHSCEIESARCGMYQIKVENHTRLRKSFIVSWSILRHPG